MSHIFITDLGILVERCTGGEILIGIPNEILQKGSIASITEVMTDLTESFKNQKATNPKPPKFLMQEYEDEWYLTFEIYVDYPTSQLRNSYSHMRDEFKKLSKQTADVRDLLSGATNPELCLPVEGTVYAGVVSDFVNRMNQSGNDLLSSANRYDCALSEINDVDETLTEEIGGAVSDMIWCYIRIGIKGGTEDDYGLTKSERCASTAERIEGHKKKAAKEAAGVSNTLRASFNES